jgi:hypothetical protein
MAYKAKRQSTLHVVDLRCHTTVYEMSSMEDAVHEDFFKNIIVTVLPWFAVIDLDPREI